jgi:hypothetical protein
MEGDIGKPGMASSKLRTHPGKFRNDGRPTITGPLLRAPIADELRRWSRSLQSIGLDGGVLANEPPDAHEVNHDSARHSIRGSDEL